MQFLKTVILACVAVALVATFAQETEAKSWATSAKEYIQDTIRNKVLSRTALMKEFNSRMAEVKELHKDEKFESEEAREAFYYKCVYEQLRSLRADVENKQVESDDLMPADMDIDDIDKKSGEHWNPDADIADDEHMERELLDKLSDIEAEITKGDTMGWSMNPEAKKMLLARSAAVMQDLMQNEIKQLALTAVTGYMSGGYSAAVMAILSSSLRHKLVQYFMNACVDVLSALMGKPIEINALPAPPTATVAPATPQQVSSSPKPAAAVV